LVLVVLGMAKLNLTLLAVLALEHLHQQIAVVAVVATMLLLEV
jgi:hypothetical protein